MSAGLKNVECPQIGTAILAVRKTGVGTPVLSGLCANQCTITDNGVGDYTITVNTKRPFAQGVIATATLHTSGIATVYVAGTDKLKVQIKTYAVDGTTATDLDFDFICIGTYASDYNY